MLRFSDFRIFLSILFHSIKVEVKVLKWSKFCTRLNNTEESLLELFIRENWLAKKLWSNSALSLYFIKDLF